MMKAGGQELITERTEKSSRFLLTSSATVFLIKHFHVPIEDLSVFGVKAPSSLFDSVAWVVILFSLVSFLVHWLGDFVSWSLWFSENRVVTTDGEVPRGHWLNRNIARLEKDIEGGANLQLNNVHYKSMVEVISGYNWRVKPIYWYGWLYIFGLHFAVPVGAAGAAVFSLWFDALPAAAQS